jgi:signal transduction histidine kinase
MVLLGAAGLCALLLLGVSLVDNPAQAPLLLAIAIVAPAAGSAAILHLGRGFASLYAMYVAASLATALSLVFCASPVFAAPLFAAQSLALCSVLVVPQPRVFVLGTLVLVLALPLLLPGLRATGLLALPLLLAAARISEDRRRNALFRFALSRRAERRLMQLQRTQEELVVVEKLEALRVLVGGLSHELNNALVVAQVSAKEARGSALSDPARTAKLLDKSLSGLARIEKSVGRLRRFAMAERGNFEATDVCALFDFALESGIGRGPSNVQIERAYEADLPPVPCDASALAEVLFHLTRNAVEAMPAGGAIVARVESTASSIHLSLTDAGAGIPEDLLPRIFDPYFGAVRDEAEYTTMHGGKGKRSGFGLSAAYGLVRSMGGSIKVENLPQRGTRATVELPRTPRL